MLSYTIDGCRNSAVIVFLHGFIGCKEDFYNLMQALKHKFCCIAVDLPGHGKSPFSENIEESILLFLDQMQLAKCHLAGYSLGGRIALSLAEKYPERFDHLVIIAAHPGLTCETARKERLQNDLMWAERLEKEPFEEFLAKWYNQDIFRSLKNNHLLYEETVRKRALQNTELLSKILVQWSLGNTEPLKSFFPRTLFLYGEEDLKYTAVYNNIRPFAKVAKLSGCGHAMHLENPSECAKKIENFIEEKMTQTPWKSKGNFTDIKYDKWDGIAKITINRPEVHNAFRPLTIEEISQALENAQQDVEVGVIILTGEGKQAFCSGGDQRVRGEAGYADLSGIHKLNVLDLQKKIRSCPKPVVAMIAGYAIGGGHVLHVMCDLSIAADNAIFGQVGPKVGSFDGGYGAGFLARSVGQKKAREIWFLCRQYNAQQALDMGLVNCVVPLDELEATTLSWCREMLQHSPLALRCLKSALNADCDGQAGVQELAGNATMLYYMTEEAQEGHKAFLEKRKPDFSRFPKRG